MADKSSNIETNQLPTQPSSAKQTHGDLKSSGYNNRGVIGNQIYLNKQNNQSQAELQQFGPLQASKMVSVFNLTPPTKILSNKT